MRFSWTSLILAPLFAPVIFSATMIVFVRGDTLMAFLTLLVFGCILSYATTIVLFLPCLFLLSLEQQMTGFKVCLLGLVMSCAELRLTAKG
jgi:preprotein translocase subunit SecF